MLFTLRLPKLFTQKATPRLRSSQSIDEEELSDSKINHFDLLGSLILFTFIACLVLGFGIAGNDVPWSHPAVLTLLPASLIFFIIFIYYELRLASFPLVPIEVFKKQAIWSLFLTTFCLDFAVMTVRLQLQSQSMKSPTVYIIEKDLSLTDLKC